MTEEIIEDEENCSDMQVACKLMMRVEDGRWNAYMIDGDMSEESKLLLGSISMSIVIYSENIKNRFIELMQDAISNIVTNFLGGDGRQKWVDDVKNKPN